MYIVTNKSKSCGLQMIPTLTLIDLDQLVLVFLTDGTGI